MGLDGDDRGRQPVQLRLKGEREREAGEGERDRREEVRSDKRKEKKRRVERLEGKIAFYKRK